MKAARSAGREGRALTIVYEIAIRAAADRVDAVRRWFDAGPARIWRELPRLRSFDAYSPAAGEAEDPHVDDGTGPCLLCMLSFPDEAALQGAIGAAAFRHGLGDLPSGAAITADAMLRKFYSVDGDVGELALAAPFSYMVRYHRPAADERAFVEHYLASHPALLARLPRIRSVLCDLPIPWADPNDLVSAQYMLGNEVAFDSVDDFNAAMQSPIRHELRAHYRNFPPFSGRNTHHPMMRARLR